MGFGEDRIDREDRKAAELEQRLIDHDRRELERLEEDGWDFPPDVLEASAKEQEVKTRRKM